MRVFWFVLGAAVASAVWAGLLSQVGQEWISVILGG